MRRLNKVTAHLSTSPTVVVMDERGGVVVMMYKKLVRDVTYLLLNILFGGLPDWLGADVDRTWLALAIIWDPVDRLEKDEGRDDFAVIVVFHNRGVMSDCCGTRFQGGRSGD